MRRLPVEDERRQLAAVVFTRCCPDQRTIRYMLISTLPDLAGRAFEVRGLVVAQAQLGAIGGGNTKKMVQQLIDQARRFNADGIVDVKTVLGGDSGYCVMTGTAVKLR